MQLSKLLISLFSSIFILLSGESDVGAIYWTNPHRLEVIHFRVFRLFLTFF